MIKNLVLQPGAALEIDVTVTDDNGAAFDLVGASALLTICRQAGGTVLASRVVDIVGNQLNVLLDPADTANLDGVYYYEIRVSTSTGLIFPAISGGLFIRPSGPGSTPLPLLISETSELDVASYEQRVKDVFGSSLLVYFPLNEASGLTAEDVSGHGWDGTYTAPTLGAAGIGDGKKAVYLGATGYMTLYTLGLFGAINGDEGSFACWAKIPASVWADASIHALAFIQTTTSDQILLMKPGVAPGTIFIVRTANGNSVDFYPDYFGTDWFHVCVTWSKSADLLALYINGSLAGSEGSLDSWTGNLNSNSRLGCTTPATTYPLTGHLAHAAIGNRALTASEVRRLATVFRPPSRFLVLGDSISIAGAARWPELVFSGHPVSYGLTRAVSGAKMVHDGIATDLADEVLLAAADDATIILILMGQNDANATGVQTALETGLAALKISNPYATIYVMGVLNSSSEVATNRAAKNTAIEAACTAQNVTYWSTDGWITPASDTSDGVHPTSAGHIKIKNQILALL